MVAVIFVKIKQRGFSIEKCVQKVQMEMSNRVDPEQSDLVLHCLP